MNHIRVHAVTAGRAATNYLSLLLPLPLILQLHLHHLLLNVYLLRYHFIVFFFNTSSFFDSTFLNFSSREETQTSICLQPFYEVRYIYIYIYSFQTHSHQRRNLVKKKKLKIEMLTN